METPWEPRESGYRSGGKRRFRAKAVTMVAGRHYRADVAGSFSSARRVAGKLKSALSGCGNSDRTKWKASKPKPKRRYGPGPCEPYVWIDDSGWPHMLYRC